MDSLEQWERRQRTRRQPSLRSRRGRGPGRSAPPPNPEGQTNRMRARRARAIRQAQEANVATETKDTRTRQIIAAILVAPLAIWMSVCMVSAALEPAESRAATINATGRRVSVSRSECLTFARQWQREENPAKRLEHATYYNLRSGCPETYGSMAQVLGIAP